MRWPIGIALSLLTVIVVDIAYIWIASAGSDPVDPTYVAETR
jgi:hypothetical protein